MLSSQSSLDRLFKIKDRGSDVKTEITAGITTFMTIAYLLAVIPNQLGIPEIGMDKSSVFTATALSALIATALVGIIGNFPFGLAPSMGLNAFFAFSIVIGMGKSWQFALTAVLIAGIILVILTLLKVREALFDVIPSNLKMAMIVGIGLFITFIGLKNAGIVASGGAILEIGNLKDPAVFIALIGIIFTGFLMHKNVKGALLIGIVAATLLGIPFGVTKLPTSPISLPPSLAPTAFKFVGMDQVLTADMAIAVFTFLFVAIFDTIGTLVGLASKANLLDENEKLPGINKAYISDSIGSIVAACLGTSFIGTTVESASGISEGGKTGLTAISTSVLFLIALFLSPLFLVIPSAATSPVLVIVGLLMVSAVKEIDFNDFTEGLPAFLTIVIMPLSYSIAEGIVIGMIAYVGLKVLTGKFKEISPVMYILSIIFILRIIFM
ncbi:xanthine/uracil/vitamin C permease [Gottschalkia acidurici 9a]|uniref:Xanthine/uracil/vitamin C permease n=1 Tax=Gottschalkia acidurici (strain ATCC 7906 / DSM 604 / BCRC 14475 / CIP 104303 / KCTC 5404 / NCIMB 10678 / 9a) TaxID=1128398 RepID=K0AWJ9_GOTA9|nr:NCS2 family permease [Gottschalkia acidurici]AFS77110.1 xanthine/uracil/vitamin C permease [Gottschalkia acidurici 9a]